MVTATTSAASPVAAPNEPFWTASGIPPPGRPYDTITRLAWRGGRPDAGEAPGGAPRPLGGAVARHTRGGPPADRLAHVLVHLAGVPAQRVRDVDRRAAEAALGAREPFSRDIRLRGIRGPPRRPGPAGVVPLRIELR
jgi:hypothetical protein